MRLRRPAPLPGAAIALTPLIDVVFILLIFFMLASRFDLWNGFNLALGPAEAAGSQVDGDRAGEKNDRSDISIILLANNDISLDGRRATAAELRAFVTDAQKVTTDRSLRFSVAAEQGAKVAALVALLEDLKAAGAADILLAPSAGGATR
ncbi:ExbD/TolR family protein [Marinibaculum pumilum]|uniref:ExbD/TolR family protein n=1 Tax=Marinibaculum pumilum TaxID=1766165 RepID=A0ABV7L182_9PROT